MPPYAVSCGFIQGRNLQRFDMRRKFLPGFLPDASARPTLPDHAVQHRVRLAPGTRKGRRNSCRLFLLRHGRDKDMPEVQRGWERAIDKAFDLKDWR